MHPRVYMGNARTIIHHESIAHLTLTHFGEAEINKPDISLHFYRPFTYLHFPIDHTLRV